MMTTMPAAYAAKEDFLRELQSPALFTAVLADQALRHTMPADVFFHALPELAGLEAAHLPAPPGHSVLLVRGEVGAHRERVAVPQQVRLHVLQGALLLWRPQAWGDEPHLVEAGQTCELAPDEQHSYVVIADCLNYNFFTPAFAPLPFSAHGNSDATPA